MHVLCIVLTLQIHDYICAVGLVTSYINTYKEPIANAPEHACMYLLHTLCGLMDDLPRVKPLPFLMLSSWVVTGHIGGRIYFQVELFSHMSWRKAWNKLLELLSRLIPCSQTQVSKPMMIW